MAPLKDALGPDAARRLAGELSRAWPGFPVRRFTRGLAGTLEPLELLARGAALSARLAATLPPAFTEAETVLRAALDSPTFTGWIVLPCGGFVARAGIDDPSRSLPLLADLTPRWSSEFAIRPFIERHPEPTYECLREWVTHDDEHVRRLVSEGTRPRLPWAPQLRRLVADPAPNVPLLDALVQDRSPYVRRSVANHLNDIAKDHADLALDLAAGWARRGDGASAVVRHGLRTLVKRGDDRALRLVGATVDGDIELRGLSAAPARIAAGDAVTFTFTLAVPANGTRSIDTVIDYRVHYIGARGEANAPRVFKLTRRRLAAGDVVTFRRRHRFENVSIRRIHPGTHTIDVQVNGRILGTTIVVVVPGR